MSDLFDPQPFSRSGIIVLFGWKYNYIIIPQPPPPQALLSGLVCHIPQGKGSSLSVQHHTKARKWRFQNGFAANLLLPSFSLTCTRSIFISIHQARDKVRCYRYDKRVCNNRENSNAFKNSIPNSYSNRNVVLVPCTSEVVRMKAMRVTRIQCPFIFPNTTETGSKNLCFQTPWHLRSF